MPASSSSARHGINTLVLALLLTAFQACAPLSLHEPTDNYLSPSFAIPAQGSLLILLPSKNSSADVAAGESFVVEQLHRQLVRAGFRVAMLDGDNYTIIWDQEVKAVGGLYDAGSGNFRNAAYAQAMAALAKRVAKETQASLVISQRLFIRNAPLLGIKAQWDGQSRTLPTTRTYGSETRFNGTTPALSVELLGLASDGSIAFKTFGGTSLPYRADTFAGRFEIRPELFASDEETADGVRLALLPLLGK